MTSGSSGDVEKQVVLRLQRLIRVGSVRCGHYEGTKTKLVLSYTFSRFVTGRLISLTYAGGGTH